MAERSAVLSIANGPPDADVMFIAEAPGRLGADRTGIPLSGDRSAANFDKLMDAAGLPREDYFITNAVLCNPRDGSDCNRRPRPEEVRTCSVFLEEQIELVNPRIIVTLGVTALDALRLLEDHQLVLSANVARPCQWAGRIVFPLYHPSPRTQRWRPFKNQKEDYSALRELITRIFHKESVELLPNHKIP